MNNGDRTKIQEHTINIFEKNFKYQIKLPTTTSDTTSDTTDTTDNVKIVELDLKKIGQEISKEKLYIDGSKIKRKIIKKNQEIPSVEVYNGDCLCYALDLKQKGYNPLVLNMANANNPGGGKRTSFKLNKLN
jgi:hypothetical protein